VLPDWTTSKSAVPAAGSLSAKKDGFRYEVFLTDVPGDIRDRDLFHRGHARIEDRVRDARACGLENLPFQSFANDEVWLLCVLWLSRRLGLIQFTLNPVTEPHTVERVFELPQSSAR
jgi:hypothetical protein